MSIENKSPEMPFRILYTMLRVGDLERSVDFYKNALGMHEIRRETFTEERFTLVFIGYGNAASDAVIELTYNWDQDNYEKGTGYGHIALEVEDIYAACQRLEKMNVPIILQPGAMTTGCDETGVREIIAFVTDPDGYKIELIETPKH